VGGETGSPGTIAQVPVITEVAPWGSGNGTYAADWFEVTNTGVRPIDLGGFKMDDNSNAFANAVALSGVSSIAPGASVIFVEGDAATAAAFKAAWFGSAGFDGVKVGSYKGSGVGLSTGGDAVNLFDAFGNRVTGVTFGASTDAVSFDNTDGATALTTLSVLGRNGAYKAGGELGSPGTIAPDTAAPVVTYSGNAGTYTVDQTVNITCAATDEARGSGIASTTCADVTGSAAALGLGTHAFSATATDNAGNVGTASGSFTVTVTPASLCGLTKRFVDGSAKYQRLTTKQQAALDKTIDLLCSATLTPIKSTTKPLAKALLVTAYKLQIAVLSADGWLTKAQANQLGGFVVKL
jgi:lamin tail-like protein